MKNLKTFSRVYFLFNISSKIRLDELISVASSNSSLRCRNLFCNFYNSTFLFYHLPWLMIGARTINFLANVKRKCFRLECTESQEQTYRKKWTNRQRDNHKQTKRMNGKKEWTERKNEQTERMYSHTSIKERQELIHRQTGSKTDRKYHHYLFRRL